MKFFGKKKETAVVDPRIMEKIKQSDLLEYIDGQRKIGKNVDLVYGQKIPKLEDNPLVFFTMHFTRLNSGIVSKKTFQEWGFTELEINAIMEKYDTKIGIAHPSRCIKDRIWGYMFEKELSRLHRESGDEKLAKDIEKTIALRRERTKWLDWDTAIEEFWIDESLKDYRRYIITE